MKALPTLACLAALATPLLQIGSSQRHGLTPEQEEILSLLEVVETANNTYPLVTKTLKVKTHLWTEHSMIIGERPGMIWPGARGNLLLNVTGDVTNLSDSVLINTTQFENSGSRSFLVDTIVAIPGDLSSPVRNTIGIGAVVTERVDGPPGRLQFQDPNRFDFEFGGR